MKFIHGIIGGLATLVIMSVSSGYAQRPPASPADPENPGNEETKKNQKL